MVRTCPTPSRHPIRWLFLLAYILVIIFVSVQLYQRNTEYKDGEYTTPSMIEAANRNAPTQSRPQSHSRQEHFVYVKIEKTGSSTFSNIFSSFGYRHGLNMMMSTNKGSLVNTREMAPGKSWKIGPDGEHPNLMEQHARYNQRFYQKHFPNNTVYITSIRDPVKWFISFVDFMKVYRGFNPRQVLEEDVLFYMERSHITGMQRQVHNNFLQWLGFDVYKSSIRKEVDKYIDFIDKQFLLVMITEYFDESLVLLKRLMNWSMADIFYTYANEAVRKSGTVLTSDEKEKLLDKDHNLGDWLLYQHFNHTFWKKVDQQEDFHEEVAVFKKLQLKVQEFCFSKELKENKEIELEIVTQWEKPFLIKDIDCLAIRVRNGKAEEFSRALDQYCPFRYQGKRRHRRSHRQKR